MRTFELYRFTHEDGTAKDWAYADLGNGQAEIRWGPRSRLRQSQVKPLREAWDRALGKVRKGYVKVGLVTLDTRGIPTPTSPTTSTGATPGKQHVPKPIDLRALLGEGDGFYF